jgi:hypothetical protein
MRWFLHQGSPKEGMASNKAGNSFLWCQIALTFDLDFSLLI